MENLKFLQSLAKEFTILLVEDSKALQKQILLLLNKFFKEVYVASDGLEGIELYKKHNPDLVLTDLTMPKMNGHEMIREIKKIDSDAEIVILSAHSDSDNLMTSFHIGVSDFIQKPITAPKMINVFLKVLSNIKRKKEHIENLLKENTTPINEDILDFIYEGNLEFDLVNHYKGVPIINKGKIIEINEHEITIKTTYNQLMAIDYEKMTTIDCPKVGENIFCELIHLDVKNYNVKLKKNKVFFPDKKHRKFSMIESNEFLKASLKKDEYESAIKILSISQKEIKFEIKDIQFKLLKHDIVEIELEFENEKTLLENIIFKIEEENNIFIVTSFIKSTAKNETSINKYIFKRELELIEEFKNLYLNN
jgi:CheY-like chemotaxis protein